MENKSEYRWRSMGSSSRGSSTRRRRRSSSSSSSSSSGWTWTNKRHVEFLNSMEASFVRTMLNNTLSPPPLDRYLPDASDSTLDLDTQPTKPARRHSTSDILGSTRIRTDKRIGRLLYQPCNISPQDLVVPQFENRRAVDDDDDDDDDDTDADEKDHQLDVTPPTHPIDRLLQ